MGKSIGRLPAILLAASLVLAACGGAALTPEPTEIPDVIITPPPVPRMTPSTGPTQSFAQKPIDRTSFVKVQSVEPDTLDPALSVEKPGVEIIQNVYETLIGYRRDSVTEFVPQLATEVPTLQNGGISPDGRTYTFQIRSGVTFHNGDPLTPEDVAFTFQRELLQGGSDSPQWLLFEPILGATDNNEITDLIDPGGGFLDNPPAVQKVNRPGLLALCHRLQQQISYDNQSRTVTIRLEQAWGPFLMVLANSSASILDKKWVAAQGGWDGDCSTWQNYYGRTVEDQNKTLLGTGENGTGPYTLDHWTQGKELVLKAYPNYWRTQPAWEGGSTGAASLQTVTIQIVKSYNDRVDLFRSGQADALGFFAPKDSEEMYSLTGETCSLDGQCTPTSNSNSNLRVYSNLPAAFRTDVLFNMNINIVGGNAFLGSGQIDGKGIPSNFFNDVHIRQAFNFCFNWDDYLKQAFNGNARQTTQVIPPGVLGNDPKAPAYHYDPAACAEAFKESAWRAPDGTTLWETGFSLQLPYNTKDALTQIVALILQKGVQAVNPKFVVQATEIPWVNYNDAYRNRKLPILFTTFHQVIADPHNWVEAYTLGRVGHSVQRLSRGIRDQFKGVVIRSVETTDPAVRAQFYRDFNALYYQVAPAILLAQEFDSHYEQRWVTGYYYNPMYGDLYYYTLSKK